MRSSRAVGLARQLGLEVEVDGHVAHHRRQPLGHARVLGVVGQVLLALGAGDLIDAGQHVLERAEALQQLGRRLVADPRDARDVVRRVALEPDEVRHELGRDAVAVDHALAVVDLRVGDAARRRHHPHAVADELVGVAVARDDHHRDVPLPRPLDQRGDHVVGLVALDGDVRVAEGLDERAQVRPLLGEQVGARRALRLVVGRDLLAPGQARVPDDDRRHLAVVGEDLHEHRREAEDRVGGPPVRRRDGFREREERAERERVPVDQEQLARRVSVGGSGHRRATLARGGGARSGGLVGRRAALPAANCTFGALFPPNVQRIDGSAARCQAIACGRDGASHLRPVLAHPARAHRPPPGHARPRRHRHRRGRRHDRRHRARRPGRPAHAARPHDRRGRRGTRARHRRGRAGGRRGRGRRLVGPHAGHARRRQARGRAQASAAHPGRPVDGLHARASRASAPPSPRTRARRSSTRSSATRSPS